MKKITILAVSLILFTGIQSQTKNFIDQPHLEVSGHADTLVTPDEIYISIKISERDTKDKISVEEMETTLVNMLKTLGLDIEKQLTARDMASSYKTYVIKKKDIMQSKEYVLKVGDASTAMKVFIALEDIDISNSHISRVDHSMAKQIKNTMRTRAANDAKTRATAFSSALNQKTGPAIHIIDNDSPGTPIFERNAMLSEVVVVGYNSKSKAELANITFEKMKIASDISIKFMLLPESK